MINYPQNPELNQKYTFNGKTWVWDGTAWVKEQTESGTVVSDTYTNTLPMPKAVLDIPKGTTFSNKTMKQMFDSLLYPFMNPAIVEPTYSIGISPSSLLQEVGTQINYTLTDNYNRGSIQNFQSNSIIYRSGEAIGYTGDGLTKAVTIALGSNSFARTVNYAAGTEPKNSDGSKYIDALPQGSILATKVVSGVYPVYATINTTKPEKLTLQSHGTTLSEINVISGICVVQIPEIWFANWAAVKIWQYDTNSGQYKIIDKTLSFEEETITIAGVNYKQFTSTETLGSRKLQFTAQ